MADLPRILARPELPSLQLPRVDVAAAGRPWAQMAQAADDWQKVFQQKQLPIEAADKSSQYNVLIEDAKNAIEANPDINTWRPEFIKKEAEARAAVLQDVTDPGVKNAVTLHANRVMGAHINDMTERAKRTAANQQLTDLDRLGSSLSLQAAGTEDPTLRASAFRTYEAALASAETPVRIGGTVDPVTGERTGGQTIPATLKPHEAEKLRQAFPIKVLNNRMEMLAVSPNMLDQEKLLKEQMAGVYNTVPQGDVAKNLERARAHQEVLINKVEKDKNEVKHQVYLGAYALANQGMWPDANAERALRGEDPWIDPDKARTLKEINDNPPDGAGNLAARTIMSKYHLGSRTRDRIQATLRELNQLQDAIGKPNKIIDQGGNELQTDIDHLDTLDVAKQNQTIKRVEDAIDAGRTPLPFNLPLFNNQKKRDDAAARDKVRRGFDPQQVIDEAVKASKGKAATKSDKEKSMDKALGR